MKTTKSTPPVACNIIADEVFSFRVKAGIANKVKNYLNQIHITKHEMESLSQICIIDTTIYTCFWFAAPLITISKMMILKRFQREQQKICNGARKENIYGTLVRICEYCHCSVTISPMKRKVIKIRI